MGAESVLAHIVKLMREVQGSRAPIQKLVDQMSAVFVPVVMALAQADVGMAIGSGADIAIEAGDVTLMRSDLQGVASAVTFARQTMLLMNQNLFWAFIYNVVGIPIAAGVFYPCGGSTGYGGVTLRAHVESAKVSMFRRRFHAPLPSPPLNDLGAVSSCIEFQRLCLSLAGEQRFKHGDGQWLLNP